jgi:hypothetical protein
MLDAMTLKRLVQTGTRARATVLSKRTVTPSVPLIGTGYAGCQELSVEVLVHPTDEPPFKTTIATKWYPLAGALIAGEDIEVWYDPADPYRRCLIDYEGALTLCELQYLESLRSQGAVSAADYQLRLAGLARRGDRAGSPPLGAKLLGQLAA